MAPPITSPLRATIPSAATTEVVALDPRSMRRRATTMGTPVKSNLRKGIQGKGILSPENLRA
jgi:hypothetical protein